MKLSGYDVLLSRLGLAVTRAQVTEVEDTRKQAFDELGPKFKGGPPMADCFNNARLNNIAK